jgi:hypothetical protein
MHDVKNPRSLLDEVMPQHDVNEIHDVWVPASPEMAYAAMKAVTPREIRLFRPLMVIRMLPNRLKRKPAEVNPSRPLLEEFLGNGFLRLGERPSAEFVMGGIGQPWRLSGNEPLKSIRTREEFLAFDEPGYSKMAVNFTIHPEGSGSRIVTETRVVGTSVEATKRFGRYWFVIKWGSAAIRRSWLNAIRRGIDRRG